MTTQLEVTSLITPITNAIKSLDDERKNLLNIGLYNYLESQTEKYYFTNTFLHRDQKVRFYEIFYPVSINYNRLTTKVDQLSELFEEYKNITLIGSAGSGKSTLVKHIFLSSLRQNFKIPVLIELRSLNEHQGDLKSLIESKILNTGLKPNKVILNRALEKGTFLFLLDGYDEIFSNKKQNVNQQIEQFVDSHRKNNFIITTRPGSGIERFPRFHDFRVENLDIQDVTNFIKKLVGNEERRDRILNIVEDPKNAGYTDYLSNPLLLSMFILAFESHPEIPSRKSAFYRNVFDTLYSIHDGITKNSFPREKLTKLQKDSFEKILNTLSFITFLEGKYTYTEEYLTDKLNIVKKSSAPNCDTENLIYDLRTSISILQKDGFEYKFPHRSLQEYFTAQFIANLPSNKKTLAYSNILKAFKDSSADYSFNFWDLCKELDKVSFTKYVLIPQLKNIETRLGNKEGQKLINSFFRIIQPNLVYIKISERRGNELWIFKQANLSNSLIQFCDIYDYELIFKFIIDSGCQKEVEEIMKNDTSKVKKHGRWKSEILNNKEMILAFERNGLASIIENIKNSFSDKIKQLEETVAKEQSNLDELLNF